MSLIVTKISLKSFRNYCESEVFLDPQLTILYGPNAVGKTNIIEALQLLTQAISFRSPNWADVVLWNESGAHISLTAEADRRLRIVDMDIEQGRRIYTVNGKKVRSKSDVAGVIPCVVFTPNDLRIIKDTSEKRRDAIDSLGTQISKQYNQLRVEYQKVLIQRNKLIKEGWINDPVFEAWTERLVSLGTALYEQRYKLLQRLLPHILSNHLAIDPQHSLVVRYKSSWIGNEEELLAPISKKKIEELFYLELESKKSEEAGRRSTVCGPHRDDIVFYIDGKDARIFGSQGQQRSIALAWKLAEVITIRDISGDNPLLLLDDVMSELDEPRRNALTSVVGSLAQTVITTANIEYFDKNLLDRATVVDVGSLNKGAVL